MVSYLFLVFLLVAVVIPVRFHLHLHGREKVFLFFVEMSLPGLRFWNYTFSFSLALPEKTGDAGVEAKPGAVEKREKLSSPALLPAVLDRASTLLGRYGIGGTLFYLFLPPRYRRWLTVAQQVEKKGKFLRFNWGTVLGLNDAALTGMAAGMLWGLKGTVLGLLQSGYKFARCTPRVMVLPSFTIPGWGTMLDCIFAVRVGHIILAGVKGLIHSHTMTGGEKNDGTPD